MQATPKALRLHIGLFGRRNVPVMAAVNKVDPITNDGLTIADALGLLERALAPFPSALEAFHARRS